MASKESTTQPVICCLGQSVAGQPTQFLLDRAFSAMRLQWQAVSVEVRPQKFALVCEAMLEMGFRGLRFYDSSATSACELLSKASSVERFVGGCSSASLQDDHWQVWDNFGYGWFDCLQRNQVSALWLHGDSRTTRSLFAAVVSSSLRWIWTSAPLQLRTEVQFSEAVGAQVESRILIADSSPVPKPIHEMLGCNLQAGEGSDNPVHRMAVVAEQPLPEIWINQIAALHVELITSSELRLPEPLVARRFAQLSPADVAVAAEAYDFQRWTGKAIDASILRDAYDEYCDF